MLLPQCRRFFVAARLRVLCHLYPWPPALGGGHRRLGASAAQCRNAGLRRYDFGLLHRYFRHPTALRDLPGDAGKAQAGGPPKGSSAEGHKRGRSEAAARSRRMKEPCAQRLSRSFGRVWRNGPAPVVRNRKRSGRRQYFSATNFIFFIGLAAGCCGAAHRAFGAGRVRRPFHLCLRLAASRVRVHAPR